MIRITTKGIREIAESLETTSQETHKQIRGTLEHMGPIIVRMMQRQMASHNVTGELSESITWSYDAQRVLRVGSNLMRKQYNAMAILERGTGPNDAVPFTPIARWAAFRGLPAGPVWMSIKQKGTTGYPISEPTVLRPEFQRSLNSGAKKLASDILVKALNFRRGMKV
jgi:hypothetical protein